MEPFLTISSPLTALPGLGAARVKAMERLGLETVLDLLTHYPRRYEDRRQFEHFPNAAEDRPVCVCGIVVSTSVKRLGFKRQIFEATLQEPERHALSSLLTLRWFNVFYVQKLIAAGQRIVAYGKPKARGAQISIEHPEFEIIEDDEESLIHLKRITPVYASVEGLSQRTLRGAIYRTLRALNLSVLPTLLPAGLDPLERGAALRGIHFPESEEERDAARRHLVLSEFFGLQLLVANRRAQIVSRPGRSHGGAGKLMERFYESLPFALTGAQQRAIGEIRADMAANRPMNRLLQGDVGSGKTFVALSAMLLAVESGYQAALMAPTQILAEQHYLVFTRWLEPLGLRVALRTTSRREETGEGRHVAPTTPAPEGELPLDLPAAREPDILIGTHALLYEKSPPPRLGLAVIDEQHKFGVLQRAGLSAGQAVPPDVLVMTATPIPRTLAITVYGDLDVSVLDELPANRGKIITRIRPDSKLREAGDFIRAQLAAGRQAYLVYPLIEESDKLSAVNAKAATVRFEHWRETLKPFRCELLHGRLSPAEKDGIMRAFRDGAIHALVATTVIEVGIDVKNANLMLIENAERFGLAQLHQLRGRIGRGEHKSYCLLMTDSRASAESVEKLGVLEQSADGFAIAEADLKLRGPGDILGTAQSGLPPLKLGDILQDADLMRLARAAARTLLEADPELRQPENQRFQTVLDKNKKLLLSQVS
jgi:ATP-dependent DNA helicase RecG